jgi:hypothetical protein
MKASKFKSHEDKNKSLELSNALLIVLSKTCNNDFK